MIERNQLVLVAVQTAGEVKLDKDNAHGTEGHTRRAADFINFNGGGPERADDLAAIAWHDVSEIAGGT